MSGLKIQTQKIITCLGKVFNSKIVLIAVQLGVDGIVGLQREKLGDCHSNTARLKVMSQQFK